jgi:hypothetical protein
MEPAVREFATATGLLEPVRELTAWLAEIIHYRRASHKARLLMIAAERIRESELPTRGLASGGWSAWARRTELSAATCRGPI